MKQNKNTTNQMEVSEAEATMLQAPTATQDLKTAVLIVSVVANLFVFTAWLALQVTTQYDSQIANFLFNR